MLLFVAFALAEDICLVQQSGSEVTYKRVLPGKHSTACPCTTNECELELMNCPLSTVTVKEPFKIFSAHCKNINKKRRVELTQEVISTVNVSDVHVLFPSNNKVYNVITSGTTVLHVNGTKIEQLKVLEHANLTISACKQDDHCLIDIGKASFDKIDSFVVGEGHKISINELVMSANQNPILQIGTFSSFKVDKAVLQGSWNVLVEGSVFNALNAVINVKELEIDHPIEIEFLEEIDNGSCAKVLSAKNLQSIPETMKYMIDDSALEFKQYDVHKGILGYDEVAKRFFVEKKGCDKPEKVDKNEKVGNTTESNETRPSGEHPLEEKIEDSNEKKCEEYIKVQLFNDTEIIFPVSELDKERVVKRKKVGSNEVKKIFFINDDGKKVYRFAVKTSSKFGVPRVRENDKFRSEIKIEKRKLKGDFVTSQGLEKESDIEFGIGNEMVIVVPGKMVGDYSIFKNYEIWEMEKQKFIIFNKETELEMPTFYTAGNYKLVRKAGSVSLCAN
ncbi:hypothetical protein EIN_405300 [Entamoeba invadens IP1]|uniref:Uncharacterized protein n=1 Tax=Entamoeba invadens IP1 TaxID=370355 RepID=A0A0A1UAB7_ENTIV|nr:hypothetical protein EIN_405300 [Entamoeba invadens IP1]ELP90116.1 hypothetical protein EIN_405300 [Entamoeba invadens IP1]|eukprot:XP_004256887.1 hypothetical protein EIN_405300 [Entamoeba invadens IP1]